MGSKARATKRFLAGNGRKSLHLRKPGPEIFAIEQYEQRKDRLHVGTPSYEKAGTPLLRADVAPGQEGLRRHGAHFIGTAARNSLTGLGASGHFPVRKYAAIADQFGVAISRRPFSVSTSWP